MAMTHLFFGTTEQDIQNVNELYLSHKRMGLAVRGCVYLKNGDIIRPRQGPFYVRFTGARYDTLEINGFRFENKNIKKVRVTLVTQKESAR